MKTFRELGTEIGELVERKAEAYGHSFAKCGEHLRLLWPDGIPPHQYTLAMLLARDFDKSMRIATDADAFGESPWNDKAGYSIIGAHLHQQTIEEISPCANASEPAAPSRPKDADSAAPNTSERTITSASAKTGIEPLPQPDGCSETLESAPASIATEVASPSAADLQQVLDGVVCHLLRLMRKLNDLGACARCGRVVRAGSLQATVYGEVFLVCGGDCARKKLEMAR